MTHIALSKLTIRARLTLVYGGLFLLAGLLLLGVTYVLVSHRLHDGGPTNDTAHPQISTTGQPTVPPPRQDSGEPGLTVNETIVGQVTNEALQTLLVQGGIALAVVGSAAIGFGWLIAGQLLQPLHRVTQTARRIADAPAADRSLHERIALDGPNDELKQLADTFDIMLERLDHSFDSQRRFIANASHELRTPLTLNRALLEVAIHRRTGPPEVRQLGETLLEINIRHERLIDGLLLLARSERDLTEPSFVDLSDIVDHVAAQTPAGTVTVRTRPGEAETTGNAVLLERLVQNLVDNGIRHNIPENGWVEVVTGTRSDGSAMLVVSNTGPVIPRHQIPHLFEPFSRLGTDRVATAPGAGLGLSIVQAIARAHDGEVRAEPRAGGGLVITVTLRSRTDTT
jgi:signal transduction histidine kinase